MRVEKVGKIGKKHRADVGSELGAFAPRSFSLEAYCHVAGWLRLYILVSSLQVADGLLDTSFWVLPSWTPVVQPCSWWICALCVLPVVVCLLPGLRIFTRNNSIRIHAAIAPCFFVIAEAMPLTADSGEEVRRGVNQPGIEEVKQGLTISPRLMQGVFQSS